MSLPAARAIVLYALWRCRDLPWTWASEPVGGGAALAFLLWAAPALACHADSDEPRSPRGYLLLALLLLLASTFLESALPRHLALALVLASPLAGSRAFAAYLLASLSWLPTLGWLLSHQLALPITAAQLVVGLFGAWIGQLARNEVRP